MEKKTETEAAALTFPFAVRIPRERLNEPFETPRRLYGEFLRYATKLAEKFV